MVSQPLPLILHYHIFKNAGTSFNWSLQQYFGERFFEYDLPGAREVISPQEIALFVEAHPGALAVSSHQAVFPIPGLTDREVLATILLRDPIARIRSIYSFERIQDVQSPGAIKAKELDFKGYVEWRLQATPAMLCNFQVHFCSRTKETKGATPEEEQFQLAVDYLEKAAAVGTVERYAEWNALTESLLESFFPGIKLHSTEMNVTNRSSSERKAKLIDHLQNELGPGLVDHLLETNQLDMRLHQVADAILTKNLATRNVSNRLRDEYRNIRQPGNDSAPLEIVAQV